MILYGEIKSKKPPGWSFTDFTIETLTFLPQQPNLSDCGLFVLKNMEIGSNCGFNFDNVRS